MDALFDLLTVDCITAHLQRCTELVWRLAAELSVEVRRYWRPDERWLSGYGIRDWASEVATELLGERSAEEVQSAKAKEVEAERFTSLNRMIERQGKKGQIDVSPSRHIGYGADDRKLVAGRLQFLSQMDLAHKGRGTHWQVEESRTGLSHRSG